MKRSLTTLALALTLLAPPTLIVTTQTGCGTFSRASTSGKAFLTLKSVWLGVDAAMKTYGTACATGKVDQAKQNEIDSKYLTFRGAWRIAVKNVNNDLSAIPPAEVQALADQLTLLISKL